MDLDSCFLLGYITRPHGLQGAVSAIIDADEPQAYQNLESVFVRQGDQLVPFFIDDIRISGNKAIIVFEDADGPDFARNLQGAELYLPLAALPELPDGGFYYHDIIGYQVEDRQHGPLGTVANVLDSGAQALLAIDYQGRELLLPLSEDTVSRADKEKQIIYVNFPEGLLDFYLHDQSDAD